MARQPGLPSDLPEKAHPEHVQRVRTVEDDLHSVTEDENLDAATHLK